MEIVLRKYQWEMRDRIYESWNKVQRVLGVLPPGAGKTAIIATIADRLAKDGEKVWILNNRSVTIQQLYQKVETITGRKVIPLWEEIDTNQPGIYISTIQYAKRHYKEWGAPSTIIIDEAHHCGSKSYQEIINYYHQSKLLGMTATPYRGDGHHLIGDTFESMIKGISMQELIDKNFLCNYQIIKAPLVTSKQLQNYMEPGELLNQESINDLNKMVRTYQEYCDKQPCLVFAPTAASCRIIANAYQNMGIAADFIESEQGENLRVLENFKAGAFSVLVNCEMLIDGIDIPMLRAIQVVRPTESLTLWIQMCGRVLRTWPEKNIAVILDHTKNYETHGNPCAEFDFINLTPKKSEKRIDKATTKQNEVTMTAQKLKTNQHMDLKKLTNNTIKKLESLLNDLDDTEFSDNYLTIKNLKKPALKLDEVTPENLDIKPWNRIPEVELLSMPIYKFYQEKGIKKTIETIEKREIPINWQIVFNLLIYVKELKEYHKKWLVYTCFSINAPLDVWQQLAIYLDYKIGWAYHCYREMQENNTKKRESTQKFEKGRKDTEKVKSRTKKRRD